MAQIEFDETNATEEEIWAWYMAEYENPNRLTQLLLNSFFKALKGCIDRLEAKDKMLEIGCGPAMSSQRIFKMLKGQHFEASEFDQRLVNKLQNNNLPFPVRQESVFELQRDDNSFDCLLLLEVLEHLNNYEKALDELFRVSTKYVIISVPNEPLWSFLNLLRGKYIQEKGNTPGHVNKWSVKTLRQLLSGYGQIELLATPLPWIVMLVRKYENKN
jgi:ubiquinone/menaquinone biosynthesis C-methylase UbiE